MMTPEEQRDAYARELAALDVAVEKTCSRLHYSTVSDILRESGLPYTLVQDSRDMLGMPLRDYRYRFASRWSSPAMLYIQETEAGRQHRSMGDAIGTLRGVLAGRLAELERRCQTPIRERYAAKQTLHDIHAPRRQA